MRNGIIRCQVQTFRFRFFQASQIQLCSEDSQPQIRCFEQGPRDSMAQLIGGAKKGNYVRAKLPVCFRVVIGASG